MPIVLVGWRAILLLCMALAPWGAPLEATLSTDLRVQIGLGFAGIVLFVALIAVRIERYTLSDRVAKLFAASLGLAVIAAGILPRGSVPLSTASVLVAVPLWLGILVWCRLRFSRSRVIPTLTVIFAVGMWVIGGGRVLNRERVWQTVATQNPSWSIAQIALLQVLSARHATDGEVAIVVDHCVAQLQAPIECHSKAIQIALRQHQWEKLLTLARDALRVMPSNAEVLRAQSIALSQLQRSDTQSIGAMQQAVESNSADVLARTNLASALQRANRSREAVTVLQAVTNSPDVATQQLLSTVAIQAEAWDVAQTAVARVLAIQPENVTARLNLGVLEQHSGHFNGAREAYLRALRTEPRNFAARYNLARLVFSVGATDEALHHAQRLLEIDARDDRVRVLVREIQDRIFAAIPDGGTAR